VPRSIKVLDLTADEGGLLRTPRPEHNEVLRIVDCQADAFVETRRRVGVQRVVVNRQRAMCLFMQIFDEALCPRHVLRRIRHEDIDVGRNNVGSRHRTRSCRSG
jgi:hypothetical protein